MASRHRHGEDRIAVPALPASPTVLLLIDVINPLNFSGAAALSAAAVETTKAIAKLRRKLSSSGIQTVYANDNYGVWRSDFHALWERCRRSAGAAGEIARILKPRREDFTVLKPRHSAFYATPLDLLLQQLECRQLIIAGLAADNCVLFTAMDAYLRGYALWVPADCVAAEQDESKRHALEQMERLLKAEVRAAFGPPSCRGE